MKHSVEVANRCINILSEYLASSDLSSEPAFRDYCAVLDRMENVVMEADMRIHANEVIAA